MDPPFDNLPQRPTSPVNLPQIGEWQSPMEKLEELCSSDDLSLPALREIVEAHTFQPRFTLIFDKVCNNKNVTLEIIQYLLVWFPNAVRSATFIIACMNENCPCDARSGELQCLSW